MEWFLNFINSSWVTSIITGFLVFYVTDLYKRIKGKKSYFQQVSLANKEIFNSIKYSIPEDNLPSIQILKAIHIATAKRYNVKFEDVDSLHAIIDYLIKEIMDSNFLSHENKLDYCQRLLDMQMELNLLEHEETVVEKVYATYKDSDSSTLATSFAPVIGFISFILVFILSSYSITEIIGTFFSTNIVYIILVMTALMTSIFFKLSIDSRIAKKALKNKNSSVE
ncbi:hypothetical protein BRE01_68370 [Brevibacillus reuszeri]|uniref:Uncharacterized protein n=1 Tax=Brevibacillus reuszeri TaxID=54915 RepID=A0A0K9YLQ8_9BACL|nr:hypothetical protein [Brevibacillus reuszeri]KNB69668.1 hypothetical protein ADS79_27855 [Brevibacillus reuszeri]MED1855948.1 hypothetical protein [Brevibacillus reuszeri]GED73135.1 hypothetical protein BRE01_68370 [Brevibacillus reuszeri]